MSHSAPLPVALQTVLGGRYRLDAVLGRGGYGAVYRATQLDLNRQVAVKVLHGHEQSGESLARFEREARATGSLGHPHIVQVTDFQPAPIPFLVMELLPGRSLAETLQAETRMAPVRAVRIAIQLLAALSATHRIGIIHRDIKPANLMLLASATGEDFVKVLDFGVAKDLMASGPFATHSGQLLGTLGYMAPEQALGTGAGPQTDLYAVAVVLYRCLSGTRPYGEATGVDLVRLLVSGVPSTPLSARDPALPPALCASVERALSGTPAARPASAEAFAAELARSVGLPPPAWASTMSAAPAAHGSNPALPPTRSDHSLVPAPTQSAPSLVAPSAGAAAPNNTGRWLLLGAAGLLFLSVGGVGAIVAVVYVRGAPAVAASATSATPPSLATSAVPAVTVAEVAPPAPSATASASAPVTATATVLRSPGTKAPDAGSPSGPASAAPKNATDVGRPDPAGKCECMGNNGLNICASTGNTSCTCLAVGGQGALCLGLTPTNQCMGTIANNMANKGPCQGTTLRDNKPAAGRWFCTGCTKDRLRYSGPNGASCSGFHPVDQTPMTGTLRCF